MGAIFLGQTQQLIVAGKTFFNPWLFFSNAEMVRVDISINNPQEADKDVRWFRDRIYRAGTYQVFGQDFGGGQDTVIDHGFIDFVTIRLGYYIRNLGTNYYAPGQNNRINLIRTELKDPITITGDVDPTASGSPGNDTELNLYGTLSGSTVGDVLAGTVNGSVGVETTSFDFDWEFNGQTSIPPGQGYVAEFESQVNHPYLILNDADLAALSAKTDTEYFGFFIDDGFQAIIRYAGWKLDTSMFTVSGI